MRLLLLLLLPIRLFAANFCGGVGDSIMMGYSNYTSFYTYQTNAFGDTNADVFCRLSVNSSGAFTGTNYGVSGALMNAINTSTSDALFNQNPMKFWVVEGGINNMAGAQTFANNLANFNTIVANGRQHGAFLIFEDVWPSTLATAVAITNWNTSLTNWIATNQFPLYFCPVHDQMANADGTMIASYTFDGTHPSLAGVDKHSLILWTNLLLFNTYLATNSTQSAVTGNRKIAGNRYSQ